MGISRVSWRTIKVHGRRTRKRIILIVLLLSLIAAIAMPLTASAQGEKKVVRVGWYESPFNQTDDKGRRSGYAYEYQQKIASYTGWKYEYIEKSWSELLQMLIDGKIDLLSDVSYTEERAESILYSALPMGAEEYFIYVTPENDQITLEDLNSFNGKKVGVDKDSVQADMFRAWALANGVEVEVLELTCSLEESLDMLLRGRLDMYVTLDLFANEINSVVPICKIGGSDFYFAVSKDRQDLLAELNGAMERIQAANRYYNHELASKYLRGSGSNLFLTNEEKNWLSEHGTIRVGYQDNYLAFCAKDPKTGELTGALKDYLALASDCLENAHLDFEAVVYPTATAALEAMKNGEVDCMFPGNLTDYECESRGISMTTPLVRTDMSAVVREGEQKTFNQKNGRVVVAVNEGNPNYDIFLKEHFPDWQPIYYKDTPTCLKAVADEIADCILISNFRYNDIGGLCEKYHLTTVSTGVTLDYSLAVDRENTALYSILSKTAGVVPEASVNAALSYYFTEEARTSVISTLKSHLGTVIAVLTGVLLGFALLYLHGARAKKKADAEEALISATEFDQLTGLYNRSYFYEFAGRLYRDHPETPRDAIVLDIERFHAVNAAGGREFGDRALKELGDEIGKFLAESEGIGGRSIGDHFGIYCLHQENYKALYDRFQGKLDALSQNAEIRLRMGVMPWQADTEPADLFEHAQIACNMARGRQNKRHLVVFDEAEREQEAHDQRLINDLRSAVKNQEFEVYYQPKFDIQVDPPQLKSAEALVRWRHPELGLLPPNEFIPLLERNGQIGILDRYVWEEAARQVARWRKQYGIVLPVSVNLSRLEVTHPKLEQTLDWMIKENELECSALKLEVTESAYIENADKVIAVVENLRKKGYEIEMDDFGSGYSSLHMLSMMPVDVLKMDKKFVDNLEHDEKDVQVVELILGIAKNLKVPVIAEGVETEKQLQILKNLGCELVQGFYFSRPLPAAEFEKKFLKI